MRKGQTRAAPLDDAQLAKLYRLRRVEKLPWSAIVERTGLGLGTVQNAVTRYAKRLKTQEGTCNGS